MRRQCIGDLFLFLQLSILILVTLQMHVCHIHTNFLQSNFSNEWNIDERERQMIMSEMQSS